MPCKLKKSTRTRSNVQSELPEHETIAEDACQSVIKPPVLPMENCTPAFSTETPSTSQNTSDEPIGLLEHNELMKINKIVNFHLDNCFQNKSEIVVNRRVLEEMMSETLGDFYSSSCKFNNEEKGEEEKKVREKYASLQAKKIQICRQYYALKKQVEQAKGTIRDMVSKQNLSIPPTAKKHFRSVGLQVCSVGLPFCIRPTNTSPFIISPQTESIQSPEEPKASREHNVNEVVLKSTNKPSTSKVNQSQVPLEKETPSGSKCKKTKAEDMVRFQPKSSDKIKLIPKCSVKTKKGKGVKKPSKIDNKEVDTNIPRSSKQKKNQDILIKEEKVIKEMHQNPSGSAWNMITRSMSRRMKLEEGKYVEPNTPIKVNSTKKRNQEIKNEKHRNQDSEDMPRVSKQEEKDEIIMKKGEVDEGADENPSGPKFNVTPRRTSPDKDYSENVIEISDDEGAEIDVIEISDDEMVDQTVTDMKELLIIGNTRDIGIQVNLIKECFCHIHDEPGVTPLLGVRTPELINELGMEALNSSITDGENIPFQLPAYPMSPKYPSNVSKPPAPLLKAERNASIGTQGTIVLTWSWRPACNIPKNIVEYELYSCRQTSGKISNSWDKVGNVEALPLPMVCYLSVDDEDVNEWNFIVRAIDSQNIMGPFSDPASINLQN